MLFRRSLAIFSTLLLILFSFLTFLWFAFSNTLLKPSFYGSMGPLQSGAYDFLVNMSAKNIISHDQFIAKYFTETDLKREIETVFTRELFAKMSDSFAGDMEKLKIQPDQPLTISLKLFRESLLTMAHNLSFRLFKVLPACSSGQIPQEDVQGVPSCLPADVEYNVISAPIAATFEKVIYGSIPEQIQYDLASIRVSGQYRLTDLFGWLANVKYVLYGILLTLVALIALLIYKPFVHVLKYEGAGFILSGAFGYLFGFALEYLPATVSSASLVELRAYIQQFLQFIFSFVSAEMQKISLIFLAVGLGIILMQIFIKRY